tara:strand:- start:349 stop:912 length:564 start_codon:yes stop_codon:yes gene_type:complete
MTDNFDTNFFNAMNSRSNVQSFKQDIYPTKSEIDNIIDESIAITPVKNNIYHYYIDVYGPEFIEEKIKLLSPMQENNEQVKAPYLLVFKKSKNYFNKRYFHNYEMELAAMGSILHGYIISILANKKNIQASFCACFKKDRPNESNIVKKRKEFYYMLGLGYVDKKARSDLNKLSLPKLDDIRKWNEF